MSYIDFRADLEAGKLTLSEAAELSRLLDEKWGVASVNVDERGDLEANFLVPLLERLAEIELATPADHLAAVRSSLARAIAA